MNKHLKNYFESKGLIVEGDRAYGIFDDYEVNAFLDPFVNVDPLKIQISCFLSSDDKLKAIQEINNEGIKKLNVVGNRYGILLGLNDITIKKLATRMDGILEKVFRALKYNGAFGSDYCPICASKFDEETKRLCSVNGFKISIDLDCVSEINNQIKTENEEFEKAPNNFVKGFVGALIGALAGAVIAVILYLLGYVSALSGFVATILGAYLYKKLGGKPNKIMIITVVATSFVVLILTTVFVYAYYAVALEYGGLATALQNAEFKSSFTHDIVMTILFTVIGSVYEIIALIKSIKRDTTL